MELSSRLARPPLRWPVPVVLAVLAAFLMVRTFAGATGHDEDQYLAGAWAARHSLVYRDFAYLQTPLQAWLFAPLADCLAPHAFIGLRAVNASLGAAALFVLYAAARRTGCGKPSSAFAVALICSIDIFSYAAATLRNDILPTLFMSLFLLNGVIAIRRRSVVRWTVAGLCIGLAAAAKISFVFPAGAAFLFLVREAVSDRSGRRNLLGYAIGGAIASIPVLAAFLSAPEAFWFDTVRYHSVAPFRWYAANGHQDLLAFAGKAASFIGYLANGPALAMLVVMILVRLRMKGWPRRAAIVRLLDAVAIGSLIAAWLPTPSWPPYLVVILPPLCIRFALFLEERRRIMPSPRLRRAACASLACLGLVGISGTLGDVRRAARNGSPIAAKAREAHWLGRTLRACGVKGDVASFTARWVVDSGYRLDARFVSSVFVFRSGGLLSPDQADRLNVVTPQTLARSFDARQPAAVVTGDQMGGGFFRLRPDMPLRRYAIQRGWTRIEHPGGRMTVFINPAARAHPSAACPTSPHPRSA